MEFSSGMNLIEYTYFHGKGQADISEFASL